MMRETSWGVNSDRMDNKMTAFFVALAIIGVAANAAISVGQGPLQVSISPSQGAVIDSGQSYSFTAVPSGTSAYRYQWYNTTGVLPILMQGQHAAGLSLVAGALGSYSYQVRVLDSSGGSASASVALTVNPAPTVSLSTEVATLDSGEEYQLSESYLPGTGAPSYLWDVGSLGVGSGWRIRQIRSAMSAPLELPLAATEFQSRSRTTPRPRMRALR